MIHTDISKAIKKGLIKGYKESLFLINSDNDFIKKITEYLLTVNVAQCLLKWNEHHLHHLYKIRIEYPVLSFHKNTMPAWELIGSDIFNTKIISNSTNYSPTAKNNQRIDIVITQEANNNNTASWERSLVGIELKGIIKQRTKIINDVKRLAQAMPKDTTDKNSIKFCFCGFLKLFQNQNILNTDDLIEKKKKKEEKYWSQICTNLNSEFASLQFSTDIFDIISAPLEKIGESHKHLDSDYSEIARETGAVVGVILTIQRK